MNPQCVKCSEPIEWRTSKRTGRRYAVNGAGGNGAPGQFHSTTCAAKGTGSRARNVYTEPAPYEPTIPAIEPIHSIHSNDTLAETIAAAVARYVPAPKSTIDETAVRAIVKASLAESGTQSIEVSVRGSDTKPVNVGRQHSSFATLCHYVGRRHNIYMVGPAGGGKTYAGHAAATAFGMQFGSISVGPQTTQSAIFGNPTATGGFVQTEFRRRYEHGGVFLFDELDRGNPGVITALNQALGNGNCAFPDGMVARHPDFVAIAAGNTYGNGASREYVGAMQLDASTLDRFVTLDWNYDETLERDIAMATYTAAGGSDHGVIQSWLSKVLHARERANTLKIRHIVSPRASIVGADLLGSGMDERTVASAVLFKGLDADSVARLS